MPHFPPGLFPFWGPFPGAAPPAGPPGAQPATSTPQTSSDATQTTGAGEHYLLIIRSNPVQGFVLISGILRKPTTLVSGLAVLFCFTSHNLILQLHVGASVITNVFQLSLGCSCVRQVKLISELSS